VKTSKAGYTTRKIHLKPTFLEAWPSFIGIEHTFFTVQPALLVFTVNNTFDWSADDKRAKVTPHIGLKLPLRLHFSFNPTQGF